MSMRALHVIATLVAGLCIPGTAGPSLAGVINSGECRAKLSRAWRLVDHIASRGSSVGKGDIAGLCRVLRTNLREMQEARDGMAACMTGRDRDENVGQLDASMEDIRAVLAQKCR